MTFGLIVRSMLVIAVFAALPLTNAQSTIAYSTLRVGNVWTTTTHSAYQLYLMSARGPKSDKDCISSGGAVGSPTDWHDGQFQMLTQGVLMGRSTDMQMVVSVGYAVERWWGGYAQKSCKFLIRT